MTTRREFLRAGVATGLAAAAALLPAGGALAQESPTEGFQHPKDPAHLTPLETVHWPQLGVAGKVAAGQPFNLMIQVGRQTHPMTADHHIEWVEVWASGKRLERIDFSEPTWVKPVLTVSLVAAAPTVFSVRLSCNLHGLWENAIKV